MSILKTTSTSWASALSTMSGSQGSRARRNHHHRRPKNKVLVSTTLTSLAFPCPSPWTEFSLETFPVISALSQLPVSDWLVSPVWLERLRQALLSFPPPPRTRLRPGICICVHRRPESLPRIQQHALYILKQMYINLLNLVVTLFWTCCDLDRKPATEP